MADIEKLKQAVNSYTGDPETLDRFVEVARTELGDNWTEIIYENLGDLIGEEREKLDHAFQYYAATMAWNEAQGYLNQTEIPDTRLVEERIPILEHWLSFFQEAGLEVVKELKQKFFTPETSFSEESDDEPYIEPLSDNSQPENQEEPEEEPLPEPEPFVEEKQSESLWLVDKIKKQTELTKNVQAWVVSRCVSLGNKEVFTYPYYGMVVDLMRQTRKDIQSLLENPDMLREVNEAYPNEITKLQDYQISLDKDIEIALQNGVSDETALIDDSLTGEDAKRILGQLDTSNTPEFSGPAPDGFEVILDTDSEESEQQIKEEYNQIENAVFSENGKNQVQDEKNASQTPQNSVKRKLSFSLGNKKPSGI